MNSEQFAYWLNGFVELNGDTQPTPEQWKSITEHLGTVFVKVTPPVQFRTDKDFGIRTLEFRPEDQLKRFLQDNNSIAWPGGIAPAITC